MEKTIQFCRGGGCTAKLGPGALARVLEKIPRVKDANLLVGYDSSDDAAVYRISEDLAIVQTLDFFPPMVDDPYTFGQIAAANALSDIYAMGADVKTALNIVCFPEEMDLNILGQILLGGSEKVQEAGGSLAGGHSIRDAEVKYGLSVMGTIHPEHIFKNDSCEEGDVLLLTKPLGTGLICTAARVGIVSEDILDKAVQSMTTLNRTASEIVRKYHVHGCTDVTGFGFLGHLCEMMGEKYTARISAENIPYLPESPKCVEEFCLTAAAQRNRNHVEAKVVFCEDSFVTEEILFDPQTSGGLLVSLPPDDAARAEKEMGMMGIPCARVGYVEARKEHSVMVEGKIV